MSDRDNLTKMSQTLDECADLVIDEIKPRRLLSQFPKSDTKEVCVRWAEAIGAILEARRHVDKLLKALVK